MAITVSFDGGSTTKYTLTEWDPSTAITDPGLFQPPYAPTNSTLVEYDLAARPEADSHPGNEIVIRSNPIVLKVIEDGTGDATDKTGLATTGGSGSGLKVNLDADGGVVVGATVHTAGTGGYKIGDTITVAALTAGTTDDVTLSVVTVS